MIGGSCAHAIALISIADGEGQPIWAFAAPAASVFGEDYRTASREDYEALVQRWTAIAPLRTGAAPDWPESMRHMPSGALIGLDRATYEDIRVRDLPMACHLTSPARETCVYYEPGAAGAAGLYERDVAIGDPQPAVPQNPQGGD